MNPHACLARIVVYEANDVVTRRVGPQNVADERFPCVACADNQDLAAMGPGSRPGGDLSERGAGP
jgi:hypothetical protein